jgi:hypothetical protein
LQICQTVEEWSWPPSFATEISASSMRSSFEKLLVDIQDIGRGNLASSARLSRRRSIENAKAAGLTGGLCCFRRDGASCDAAQPAGS